MPAPRLKGKHGGGRSAPMSEAEVRRNVELHLLHGYGFEYGFPGNATYTEHHRELTHAVLRRLWPEHKARILKAWRDPGTRPHGWWLCECPEPQRRAFLEAWRLDYQWRMSDDAEEPDDSLEEIQGRLLLELPEGDNEP